MLHKKYFLTKTKTVTEQRNKEIAFNSDYLEISIPEIQKLTRLLYFLKNHDGHRRRQQHYQLTQVN